MDVSKVIKRLENYEKKARQLGKEAWLSDIGDNLYDYMVYCKNESKEPSLEDFIQWIDD